MPTTDWAARARSLSEQASAIDFSPVRNTQSSGWLDLRGIQKTLSNRVSSAADSDYGTHIVTQAVLSSIIENDSHLKSQELADQKQREAEQRRREDERARVERERRQQLEQRVEELTLRRNRWKKGGVLCGILGVVALILAFVIGSSGGDAFAYMLALAVTLLVVFCPACLGGYIGWGSNPKWVNAQGALRRFEESTRNRTL